MVNEAYIAVVARTAGGRKGGRLAGWHPADLAAEVINALLERSGVRPDAVDDVILGCVQQIGEQSTNIARSAVLASRLPESVPATTVDRQCGSSQQALHFAAQAVMSGTMDLVIAGGVESMSRIPMGIPYRVALENGLGEYVSPGIRSRYPNATFNQFQAAESVARKYELSRDQLDQYAYESHVRAVRATRDGLFNEEITPVRISRPGGLVVDELHAIDEGIRFDPSLDAIRGLNPLTEEGRLTAGSSSQICDGASAVMVVNERGLRKVGCDPLARIHHISVLGHDPVMMLEAPIPATARALQQSGLRLEDIDVFEVNEAFASIPLAWLKATGVDHGKVNVNGGAIALGHPLGASGTRLMATLIGVLAQRQGRFGLQTMCEGGGMSNVTIIERLHPAN